MRVGRMVSLEKLHGIASGSMSAIGTLVSVMSFVLAKETEDSNARDAIKACNDLAGWTKVMPSLSAVAEEDSGLRGMWRRA